MTPNRFTTEDNQNEKRIPSARTISAILNSSIEPWNSMTKVWYLLCKSKGLLQIQNHGIRICRGPKSIHHQLTNTGLRLH